VTLVDHRLQLVAVAAVFFLQRGFVELEGAGEDIGPLQAGAAQAFAGILRTCRSRFAGR